VSDNAIDSGAAIVSIKGGSKRSKAATPAVEPYLMKKAGSKGKVRCYKFIRPFTFVSEQVQDGLVNDFSILT